MSDRLRTGLGIGLAAIALALCALSALRPAISTAAYAAEALFAQAEPDTAPVSASGGGLDVNTASAEALTGLFGIGPAIAERVVAERELNGPFYYPEDLMHVPGIGPQKLAGIRDMIRTDIMKGGE